MRRVVGSRRRGEAGGGTLLAVTSALLLLSAGLVGALWATVSAGHHRAVAAAELAALSAAQVLQATGQDACPTARRIAAEHRAEIFDCQVNGEEVLVIAAVRLDLGALGASFTRAAARAGPVQQTGPGDG